MTSWKRFDDVGLQNLLSRLENCGKTCRKQGWVAQWEENGRQFKLERRSNSARTFIRYTARDSSAKRHSLIFPKGKGMKKGWALLAKKLRSLGVDYKKKVEVRKRLEKEAKKQTKGNSTFAASYAETVILGLNEPAEEVSISLGKEEVRDKLRWLDRCLVG